MQSIVDAEFQNHTIVSIGHKLDNVINYDKVAVLEAGHLVEFESPEVLLSNSRSHFSRLYQKSRRVKVRYEAVEDITVGGGVAIAEGEVEIDQKGEKSSI